MRAFQRNSPERPPILQSFQRLWLEKQELLTTTQNIAEFWNVSTRPASARGSLGLAPSIVEPRVKLIERVCRIVPFDLADYVHWRSLIVRYQICGVSVHDARLVAVMLSNQVPTILTLNDSDFRRYHEIDVHTPSSLLSATLK
ncbi:type II toxin-antitoxin system VapC family toxin [Anatilimnocola aggregata]|uniref:type II toxin-antitoxin system VapC family toxin n=1 Tax=Anatilimnocola aggregata TaxID=2528021 RepID=UPI0011A1088A